MAEKTTPEQEQAIIAAQVQRNRDPGSWGIPDWELLPTKEKLERLASGLRTLYRPPQISPGGDARRNSRSAPIMAMLYGATPEVESARQAVSGIPVDKAFEGKNLWPVGDQYDGSWIQSLLLCALALHMVAARKQAAGKPYYINPFAFSLKTPPKTAGEKIAGGFASIFKAGANAISQSFGGPPVFGSDGSNGKSGPTKPGRADQYPKLAKRAARGWFGPPAARWARQDAMDAILLGLASKETMRADYASFGAGLLGAASIAESISSGKAGEKAAEIGQAVTGSIDKVFGG